MAKQTSTDYAEIFSLIGRLKSSIQDNPEAQRVIRQLEKKCIQHLDNPKATSSEKGKNVYKIAVLLMQLERIAEDHWEEIKAFFK